MQALGVAGAPAPGRLTTTFVLTGGILVDSGAAAHGLDVASRQAILHLLLTHAHLDHTLGIPFLLGDGARPRIHGLKQTLDAVRDHLLDGHIWPDLTDLVEWNEIGLGTVLRYDPWEIEVGPANHTVPCCSYLCRAGDRSVAIVGDTRFDETVARWVGERSPDACAIEAAFPDEVAAMANRFGHQTPRDLKHWRAHLGPSCEILVTHMKSQHEAKIRAQCAALKDPRLRILSDGDTA